MASYPIVRMYDSVEKAKAALAGLKNWGFEDELLNLVTAGSVPRANAPVGAASDDPLLSAIMSGYVLKSDARVYAEGIRRGLTLVSVVAPFGTGGVAIEILERSGPVDSGLPPDDSDPMPMWDDAAPMSSALSMPVLSKNLTPFSSFWAMPAITRKGGTLSGLLGIPSVSSSGWSFSGALGMPALSKNPAPFSSLLNLPLLR